MADNKYYKHNMQDVADRAQVSKATVSRVLSGHPYINEKTRAKVLRAIEELNYRPNIVAQSIFTGKTRNIGVIMPFFNLEYHSTILQAIEETAYAHNFTVTVISAKYNATAQVPESIHRLIERRVDGLIIMPSNQLEIEKHHFQELVQNQVDFVLIDCHIKDLKTSSVLPDNRQGAILAAEHLVGLGHRRLAHFGAVNTSWSGPIRFKAFREVLAKHGLSFDERYLINAVDDHVEDGHAAARQFMSLPEPPTAIFAHSDYGAVGLLKGLQELGVAVPGQVSVLGFGDLFYHYRYFAPVPLTTVSQGVAEMGRTAFELLLARMQDGETRPRKVVVPTRLIERESTAPPPPARARARMHRN